MKKIKIGTLETKESSRNISNNIIQEENLIEGLNYNNNYLNEQISTIRRKRNFIFNNE